MKEARQCPVCKITFLARTSPSRIGRGKYCSKSCGNSVTSVIHGYSRTPTYTVWATMLQRCENANADNYSRYGGLGISVCERWHDFKNFFVDMGERPKGYAIDRKNGALGYFKENCHWATPKQQQRNLKNNVLITYKGRTQCISAWAEEIGITHKVISYRYHRGWPVNQVFQVPVKYGNRVVKTDPAPLLFG